ncbi:CehA/McbA family metallohydrolase [Gimesia fumaroli]|uniref:Uncharacterized protein n=1 Tax=Gimesia fumaroli TaxID=2527976 RepID=A0A518II48_9PLAN|nr:CehA/McbA family metallohydrolase [Gimesia fumaroli]QDV52773.1 hypothetical protein Enr17x_48400 [Gimesia fumaroli]
MYRLALLLSLFVVPFQSVSAAVLKGTIVDSLTGKIIPARLSIQAADGTAYYAKSADEAGSAILYDKQRSPTSIERHVTLSAHPFEVELPPGEYRLTAYRGKEYIPRMQTVDVEDQPREVRLKLKRWSNMAEEGWYSGDTHVHRLVKELPNVMQAEDLNVALPLTNWVSIAGQPPSRGDMNTDQAAVKAAPVYVDPTHVYYPLNTEYEITKVGKQRHVLGAVFVLNQKQVLELGAPPVAPIAEAAHKQGALLDLDKHSWPWSMMLVPVMDVDLFELSNNHLWRTEFFFKNFFGKARPEYLNLERDEKGLTEKGWMQFGFQMYYTMLNCGYRMRPTAGTASGVHPVPLGFGRVYVHLPDGFSYEKWMAGLNAGRSFVTTGPMLTLNVNGSDVGKTHQKSGDAEYECHLQGTARYWKPISRIEVIVNGDVVETIPLEKQRKGTTFIFPIDHKMKLSGSAWVAVRCFTQAETGRTRFAHTAPVYFDVPGQPVRPKRAAVQYLILRMEEEIARNQGVSSEACVNEYRKALKIYQRLLPTAR